MTAFGNLRTDKRSFASYGNAIFSSMIYIHYLASYGDVAKQTLNR
jgi:hypothetical protein